LDLKLSPSKKTCLGCPQRIKKTFPHAMPIKTCEKLGPEKQAAAGPGNPQPPQQLECAHWRLEKN
jgi:hypothetical protein